MDNVLEFLRVKTLQVAMMVARGYQYQENEQIFLNGVDNVPIDYFMQMYNISDPSRYNGSTLSAYYVKDGSVTCVYYIPYVKGETVGVKLKEKILELIKNYNASTIIFVHKSKLTAPMRKMLDEFISPPTLEVFTYDEILADITRHFLAKKMSAVADMSVLGGVSPHMLPVARTTDPYVKYYGFQEGTILRIVSRQTFPSESHLAERIEYKVVKKLQTRKTTKTVKK